jgi:hypothetical protein
LSGAPPPPAIPTRRTSPPKLVLEEALVLEPVSLATLGANSTRPEIDELLNGLTDQELAYLAIEATRLVKRRLARGQGTGLDLKQAAEGSRLLMIPFAESAVS